MAKILRVLIANLIWFVFIWIIGLALLQTAAAAAQPARQQRAVPKQVANRYTVDPPRSNQTVLPTWVPYAASLLALGITVGSFYFQWIHARGARVTLLNDKDRQNSAVRPWGRLPRNVQNDFPEFDQTYPGYALVRLVVLNTGDRPGYLKIDSAEADVPWPTIDEARRPRMSYYTYVVIPALSVTDKLIIVRNLPDIETGTDIVIRLQLTTGGPAGRFRSRLRKHQYDCVLGVRLIPSKVAGIFSKAHVEASES
jgi:hypothetical protein